MSFGNGRRRGAGGGALQREQNALGLRPHLKLPPRRPAPVFGPYSSSVGDAATSLPALALEELGRQVAAEAPFGELSLWALQDSEESFVPAQTKKKYLAFPVDPRRLSAAQAAAFGQPIPFVAVLSERMTKLSDVEAAWENTPYEDAGTEVVYREDDGKGVPTGYFLHWANLRGDQVAVDYSKLGPSVIALGGILVYLLPAGITGKERPAPEIPFSVAHEVRTGPVVAPITTAAPVIEMLPAEIESDGTMAPSTAPPATPGTFVQAVFLAAVTGGSVMLGYSLVNSLRSKP